MRYENRSKVILLCDEIDRLSGLLESLKEDNHVKVAFKNGGLILIIDPGSGHIYAKHANDMLVAIRKEVENEIAILNQQLADL